MQKKVLIAGGSGAIGQSIAQVYSERGFDVFILTRKKSDDVKNVYWNPVTSELNWENGKIDVLINLCGAGIAEKRWSDSRKAILESSRIDVTEFLFDWMNNNGISIRRYIGASGVTAFPFDKGKEYSESDDISGGYIQSLVKNWEQAHSLFKSITSVSIVRVAPTVKLESGLIVKMQSIIKKGIGSYLGKGSQLTQWIHHIDLARIFFHLSDSGLDGIHHGSAGNCTNKELTDTIALHLGKKIWLPKTPAFLIRMMFGEMSDIMLGSLSVTSNKISQSGFEFKYPQLNDAIAEIYGNH